MISTPNADTPKRVIADTSPGHTGCNAATKEGGINYSRNLIFFKSVPN